MPKKIAIIGLGYVGLPLARLFATQYQVVGFDINQKRINELNSGQIKPLRFLMRFYRRSWFPILKLLKKACFVPLISMRSRMRISTSLPFRRLSIKITAPILDLYILRLKPLDPSLRKAIL